ncbi:ATP-grasp domain-containing protein [Brevibacillus agri]|uniref:ATP-grasp domain-containing protein n=1 Tax=Brevibacillus agri TaxID=51101 RepID=UPI002867BC7C|nr:ATP-grasp domain-containing protein [Brevibacillus agri]
MNVLLTSVGRRVKLIEYFVREWGSAGKIIAADCDPTAPALFAAHHRQIVPRIDDPAYVQTLEEICLRYDIKAVLSLIDPELGVLAAHAERFSRLGVQAVVSGLDAVNLCLDKKGTCDFLHAHGLPCVPTYTLEEARAALACGELTYPLLAKPRKGSASLGLVRMEKEAELAAFTHKKDELIVQPFLQAEEYGVDGYADLFTGELTTLFTRKKMRMRAGETDRSLAIRDERLTSLVTSLVSVLPLRGPFDIDCFLLGDQYAISEINPRFGGGYPHAHESGVNAVAALFRNLRKEASKPNIGDYEAGTIMLKYDQVMLVHSSRLTGEGM